MRYNIFDQSLYEMWLYLVKELYFKPEYAKHFDDGIPDEKVQKALMERISFHKERLLKVIRKTSPRHEFNPIDSMCAFTFLLNSGLIYNYENENMFNEVPSIHEYNTVPLDLIKKLGRDIKKNLDVNIRKARSRGGGVSVVTFLRATEPDLVKEKGDELLKFVGSGDSDRINVFMSLKAIALVSQDLEYVMSFMYNYACEFKIPLPTKNPSEGPLTRNEWYDFYRRFVNKRDKLRDSFGGKILEIPNKDLLKRELRGFEAHYLASFIKFESDKMK